MFVFPYLSISIELTDVTLVSDDTYGYDEEDEEDEECFQLVLKKDVIW